MIWISSRQKKLIKYALLLWLLNTTVTVLCAKGESQGTWEPVSVFKIQWILNAGLPEGKLCLSRFKFPSYYLNDGNVIFGRKEIATDSFYVIDVEQDLAEEIPSKESVLVLKRYVRESKYIRKEK